MKTYLNIVGAMLAAVLAMPVAAGTMEYAEMQCRAEAREDGVAEEDMAEYLRECIAAYQEEQGGGYEAVPVQDEATGDPGTADVGAES